MKKSSVILHNITILFLFNFLFWFCNSYPKRILEVSMQGPVIAVVLNTMFYILFALWLVTVFSMSETVFSPSFIASFKLTQKKSIAVNTAAIIISKIILDIVGVFLIPSNSKLGFTLTVVITLVEWVIVYALLTYRKISLLKTKKALILTVLAISLVTAIAIIANIKLGTSYENLYIKFIPESEKISTSTQNIDFIRGIVSLIYDFIIGLILIVSHTVISKRGEQVKKKSVKLHGEAFFGIVSYFVRLVLMIAVLSACVFVKTVLYPSNTLKDINVRGTSATPHISDDSFYTNKKIVTVSRVDSSKNLEICYINTFIDIYFNKQKICSLTENTATTPVKQTESGSRTYSINNRLSKYSVNNEYFYLYKNRVICYVENERAKDIRFEEIAESEYDPQISELLKSFISEGNIEAFEYGCEYLLKFDEAFIMPYLTRYSKGEFNSEELRVISEIEYRQDYIINIAKGLLNCHSNIIER